MTLSQGLGRKRWASTARSGEKIVAEGETKSELRSMVAGADFMPMVSETVSYRYSCRRSECRLILLREAQWLIGTSGDGGDRQMWFCLACGSEYKHSSKSMSVDTIGTSRSTT